MDSADVMECSCKLHDAVLEGNYEMIQKILQSQSCNVNEADKRAGGNGRTAIHIAAVRGRADIVDLLLSNGADVSICDHLGNTPLHVCGHFETIELLAEHGANALQRNKKGFTASQLAMRRGAPGLAYSLLCQLEHEGQEEQNQPTDNKARFWAGGVRHWSRRGGQALSGVWQEAACDLGLRNCLLLVLGLLALSLYAAYTLTGLHAARHTPIPVEGYADSFKLRL